jgi:hypothetical protein
MQILNEALLNFYFSTMALTGKSDGSSVLTSLACVREPRQNLGRCLYREDVMVKKVLFIVAGLTLVTSLGACVMGESKNTLSTQVDATKKEEMARRGMK